MINIKREHIVNNIVKRDRAIIDYLVAKYGAASVHKAMKIVNENINKNNISVNNG